MSNDCKFKRLKAMPEKTSDEQLTKIESLLNFYKEVAGKPYPLNVPQSIAKYENYLDNLILSVNKFVC